MLALVLTASLALIVAFFYLLRRWTWRKQHELDAPEFQIWFASNYFGINLPQELFSGPAKPGTVGQRTEPVGSRRTTAH